MRIWRILMAAALMGACEMRPPRLAPSTRINACEAVPAAPDAAIASLIDPLIDAAVAKGFAGEIAVMRGGAPVYSRGAGFADLSGETPVTPATLYHVASLTKYFTAVLALKAVEEGRLTLNASSKKLFAGTPLAARNFTLAELLAHRSGLKSTYAAESESDPAAAIEAIARANKDNPKDGEFHYANDGYDLVAIALERAYAKRYEDLVREKIARPACLEHFGFWGETAIADPTIRGQPLTPSDPKLSTRNYGMIGSAGLLVSAIDLVRFERALNDGRILRGDSLAELRAPRGMVSVGEALFGSFLVDTPLGPAISARGAEDWGDNAYLNDYRDCGLIVAITTSRGPAEESGERLFRDQLISGIEKSLEPFCDA